MTQPAKVQEPSMEEILASIRRIIADDEAKPPAADAKPAPAAAPPAKPAAAKPPAAPAPKAAAPAAAKPAAPAAPATAPSNSQDDIDALLAGIDDIATAAQEKIPDAPSDDVLELTDEMAVAEPEPKPTFQKVEPQDDLEFAETASRATPRPPAFEPAPMELTPAQNILSQSTVAAVESAFNTLANTVLSNNARTLEDLVKEMLRPMLKSWLDDNLPGLVERIVRAEIERVSRGR